MKRILEFCLVACVSQYVVPAQSTRDTAVREVQQASQLLNDALLHGDSNALAVLYADSYIHVDQYGERTGKQERLEEFASGQRRFQATSPHEDVRYEVYGDMVIVSQKSTPTVPSQTFNGRAVSVRPTTVTRVWVKRDGRWQVALAQTTPITPH